LDQYLALPIEKADPILTKTIKKEKIIVFENNILLFGSFNA